MNDPDVLIGVLLEDTCLTLDQLCSVCAVEPEWVTGHVQSGHLQASAADPGRWRFGSREVRRARQIRQVEVAFDAVPELAALVADLIEELESLRARLPQPQ
jgi:chaperone modulatory protein CbpM